MKRIVYKEPAVWIEIDDVWSGKSPRPTDKEAPAWKTSPTNTQKAAPEIISFINQLTN